MRYFKRHWNEDRGDEHSDWGSATDFFEATGSFRRTQSPAVPATPLPTALPRPPSIVGTHWSLQSGFGLGPSQRRRAARWGLSSAAKSVCFWITAVLALSPAQLFLSKSSWTPWCDLFGLKTDKFYGHLRTSVLKWWANVLHAAVMGSSPPLPPAFPKEFEVLSFFRTLSELSWVANTGVERTAMTDLFKDRPQGGI